MIIKNIFVPLDFSKNSDRALEYATQLAERNGAKLTLFHAIVMYEYDFNDEAKLANYEEVIKSQHHVVKGNLDENVESIAARGIKVEAVIERGISAVDIILNHLEKHTYDLVIMGTRGRTGLKHLLQGSTAERVVRHSPIPVLTVHSDQKEFSLKHILVPVDFSRSSEQALKHVMEIRGKDAAEITLIHVVESQIYPAYYASGANSVFDIDADLKDRVEENMKKLADEAGLKKDVHFVVMEGISHQVIVDYARTHEIDLIIIASRGLTGLEHILMGSTTEKVIRLTNKPVITFKD